MKSYLLAITATVAITTSLLATPTVDITVADGQNVSASTIGALDLNSMIYVPSGSILPVISSLSLQSGTSQVGGSSGNISLPHMNKPYIAPAPPITVPDGGLTALLLVLGISGLTLLGLKKFALRRVG
jgi:hypothetical protein